MLSVKKLNKYYKRKNNSKLHVINNTTLELPDNGLIAVTGASGMGKTTLLNTVSGLDSFLSGEINFNEVSMKKYNTKTADKLRLENYGFIFQNYYLLKDKSVYENVCLSLDPFKISEKEKRNRVLYVLELLGIARYTNKLVSSLSGGEQQRVSIARALVKAPKVIFADEPTGSLDEKNTFTVLNILKKISKNCLVFIVTHEQELISFYADYIIELDKGVVINKFVPSNLNNTSLAIDRNIYLADLEEKKVLNNDNLNISYYSDNSNTKLGNIVIAIKENHIYLEADQNVVVFNEKSENHIIKGEPKKIKDYVDLSFEYELPPLEYENNKLGIISIFRKGYLNFKKKSPIKRLLRMVLVVLSIIMVIMVESIKAINNTDLSADLTTSKGNIYLNFAPGSNMTRDAMLSDYAKSLATILEECDYGGKVMFKPGNVLTFDYNGFKQIASTRFTVSKFDFKTLDFFDEDTLVYGKLPESPYEILVDEYVFERFLSNSMISNIISNYVYFIGKEFSISNHDVKLKVVGICRTKNPTIYGLESLCYLFLNPVSYNRIITIDDFKKLYPEFSDLVLSAGECLIKENMKNDKYDLTVKETFAETYPYDIVINSADYSRIRIATAYYQRSLGFYIETDGSEEMVQKYIDLVTKEADSYLIEGTEMKALKLTVINQYQKEYDSAMSDLESILFYVRIISAILILVSVLLVIVSTNQSLVNQINEIAVYRSLGYSRSNIGLSYFVEMLLTSIIYVFIGTILAFLALLVIDIIPIIKYSIFTSFVDILWLSLLIIIVISIISIIPIIHLLSLTPTNIYNHYSKKIEQ